VQWGTRHLRAGEQVALVDGDPSPEWMIGRTRLRLRLPQHALAPELSLSPTRSWWARQGGAVAGVLMLVGLVGRGWLDTDADALARDLAGSLLAAVLGGALWCGAWALLSKTFTRQARFGWHLRVFLSSGVALLVVGSVPAAIAFALSWPWLTDYAFVGDIGVAATALYFHLLAVEPARHRAMRWAALSCALTGLAVTLWFNQQRSDRFGQELYMSHLFPPALRLARPVPVSTFVDSLGSLKAALDRKAGELGRGDE
jgi:hypothetical protein